MLNLVYLSVSECTALKSFVPTMYLPSLERLFFNSCSRLEHFPHVVQKMDKPLMIHMIGTAIQQLPNSIGNLTGLEYIDMSFCKGLRDLPRNFFLLPKLVTLKISGCSLLGESFKRFNESYSIANGCPNLKTLYFRNANLMDEDLYTILEIFPKLEELQVSHNNFISLPEFIKKHFCLKSLDVSSCRNLQEIPKLSPSIQKVNARHCWSLTSQASTLLSSKVREENDRFEVVMPKMEIPQWFDRVCNEYIPLFWVRRKFPIVALAFVFGEMYCARGILSIGAPLKFESQPVDLRLFIDGVEVCCKDYHYFDVGENHMILCDLRVLFDDEKWQDLDATLGDDWKVVQVSCLSWFILRQWGVYVYKQQTNTDDIKFSLPSPTSSRPCVPSLLVPRRAPERITWEDPFDFILNMSPMFPVEEIRTLELLLLSITHKDKISAITHGTSLHQQKQDFIRQYGRVHESTPVMKQKMGAFFSHPEMANMITSISEGLKRSGIMDEGSPYFEMQRTLGEPMSLKDWSYLMNALVLHPLEDDLLMQLRERFRWIANTSIHEASASAVNGTKSKQQDEASSSSQILGFTEVPASTPVISQIPMLKDMLCQIWEEINQHLGGGS